MLRVDNIKIVNVGPIRDLYLQFDPHFNIICGMNGIGKTTILECIAQTFTLNLLTLKKTAGTERGSWSVNGHDDNGILNQTMITNSISPNENNTDNFGMYLKANQVIVFKTHRNIDYQNLVSITTDPAKDANNMYGEAVSGSVSHDIKNWFVNRHLWSAHENHLDEIQLKNLELAKATFSLLNEDISFSRVDARTNDILLNTPNGEIIFEYLSSGYKSCISVLLGLIKEVEHRYKNPGKYVKDFDGIIFIDELDLHLHPEWQAKIYLALKEILPNAQLFTSTHSPHIIQVAEAREIIPLTLDEKNQVTYHQVINEEYGCQGWTVEEILKDVMGMSETRTKIYLDAIDSFNAAIDNEQATLARDCFSLIDKMLHPESSLRKILKIQLIGLE